MLMIELSAFDRCVTEASAGAAWPATSGCGAIFRGHRQSGHPWLRYGRMYWLRTSCGAVSRPPISMVHLLERFEHECGERLSRPVAPDHRLRCYFIDRQFAAAASARAFDGEEELGKWAGRDAGSGRFRTMASRWQPV